MGLQEYEGHSHSEDDALFLFPLLWVHRMLRLETVGTPLVAESSAPSQDKDADELGWGSRHWWSREER